MIRFALRCANGHGFESWFQSNASYEKLAAAGQITCPHCASADVKKAPMAPAVASSSPAVTEQPTNDVSGRYTTQDLSIPVDPAAARMIELARQIRARLITDADYVGADFVKEARARHEKGSAPATDSQPSSDGNTDTDRPIWGEASIDEARSLLEDGIAILPVPKLPEDQN